MNYIKYAGHDISKLSNKIRRKMDAFSTKESFSGSQGRVLHFLLAQTHTRVNKLYRGEFT